MNTLCTLIKDYTNIKNPIFSSLVFMLILTSIFPMLLIVTIDSLYELIYFFTAFSLGVVAILTQTEPNDFLYILALIGWIYIVFLSKWIKSKEKVCRIQGWYAFSNSVVGALVIIGKFY